MSAPTGNSDQGHSSTQSAPSQDSPPGGSRRSIGHLLSQRNQQFRYLLFSLAFGVTAMSAFIIAFLLFLKQLVANLTLTNSIAPEVAQSLNWSLMISLLATMACAFVLIAVMIRLGIKMGNRIYGPIVPIKRLIGDLTNGDYSARGQLRNKDEFQDVMESLNQLAAQLESRHGSKGS